MANVQSRPRLVGVNHIALEVADIGEALGFYGSVFDVQLRGRMAGAAFIDIGDQFIALMAPRWGDPAHFGLVVDDKEAARRQLQAVGANVLPGRRGLDFRDPFGNLVQIVQYDQIQFTKAERILRGMGLELGKTERALKELREKGLD